MQNRLLSACQFGAKTLK